MRKPGRPVGARIREVLELIDRMGPSPSAIVYQTLPHISKRGANMYCTRAVKMGLMTTDRTASPHTFTAVDNWQWLADNTAPVAERVLEKLAPTFQSHVLHSIWGASP